MILIFGASIFSSAFLLFWCQPMLGKMLLPILGSTPAVWIASMFFFQTMLLAGYVYAHRLTSLIPLRLQMAVHFLLLLAAFIFLPMKIAPEVSRTIFSSSPPLIGLFRLLLFSVGLPFFVISATSPLLQKWFSFGFHSSAGDPYFLYVASNGGSLLALVAYPLLMEPLLTLEGQNRAWSFGFAMLTFLFLVIFFLAWKWGKTREAQNSVPLDADFPPMERSPSWGRRWRWIFLAFVPSSLMLGVTSYLTNDIASFPLLWVGPLAVYLLTFTIAFSRRTLAVSRWGRRLLAGSTVVLAFAILCEIRAPVMFLFAVAFLYLFCAALSCHGELNADRPSTRYLTHFYLYISLGGALGGFFNSLVAPLIFKRLGELPVVMILLYLGFYKPDPAKGRRQHILDALLPALFAVLAIGWVLGLSRAIPASSKWLVVVTFAVPLVGVYVLQHRPMRFAIGLGAIFISSLFFQVGGGRLLLSERNFFGTLRVIRIDEGPVLCFFHGAIIHGMQFELPERRNEPLAYYHRLGPFGQVMSEFNSRQGRQSVAVIGMGVGTMLAYATPEQCWTYYEIDPDIVRLAENGRFFTYFRDTRAASVQVIVGDARLRLEEAGAGQYDMLVLDAFSSDVVPTHLLTRQAFFLYFSKLAKDGMIAVHISSQNLDLAPVLAAVARSLGLIVRFQEDNWMLIEGKPIAGKFYSSWALVARKEADLGGLRDDIRWKQGDDLPLRRPWTDDFSNILTVLNWF